MKKKKIIKLIESMIEDLEAGKAKHWWDYPPEHKRGTYFQRRTVKRKLSPEDIESLPPKHNA